MMNEPTLEKLRTMRLEGMAASWLEQQKDTTATKLAFDERFGMLVDAEWLHRENKRLGRALKEREAQTLAGVRRGHRLPGATRARQGGGPPALLMPLGPGTPGGPDHTADGHGKDLRRVRARAAGVPEGIPCSLQACIAPLR